MRTTRIERLMASFTTAFVAVAVFAGCVHAPFARAASIPPQPPAPAGYASEAEVRGAIIAGKVKMLNPAYFDTSSVVIENDIEFAKVGERSLKLDLYRPKNTPVKPVPGIIVIYGGSWKGGKKADMRGYGIHYAQLGYVAACIEYRLTKEASHPSQVTDCKAGVRWMRANAEKYNIDPNKLCAMGNSAGGHLAMMVGYTDQKELEGDYGNPGVSSRVQAVIEYYGPADLTLENARDVGPVVALMGGKKFADDPEPYKLESPLFSLTKDDPPTLVLHGTIDTVVSVKQSDVLVEKLKELGIAHDYVRLEGWPHAMDIAIPVFEYCTWHIDRFLEKNLPLPK
jgi:acetyl esterase/lipase